MNRFNLHLHAGEILDLCIYIVFHTVVRLLGEGINIIRIHERPLGEEKNKILNNVIIYTVNKC